MMFVNRLRRQRSAARKLLARLTAVVAVAGALALLGFPVPTAHAQPNTGVDRYGGCLAAQKSGDLLILVDASSSLQQTDPTAARVQAAQYLVRTLGRYADRIGAKLDVAIAGFAENYYPEHDWSPLTGATADSVADAMSPVASKNTGIDTDYWLALDGARQALAARGAGVGGGDRCQAIAWFSDGMIDFTARPLVKPEFWREVSLTTVKGRPYSRAIGALVHEAMRSAWLDEEALAVRNHPSASEEPDPA